MGRPRHRRGVRSPLTADGVPGLWSTAAGAHYSARLGHPGNPLTGGPGGPSGGRCRRVRADPAQLHAAATTPARLRSRRTLSCPRWSSCVLLVSCSSRWDRRRSSSRLPCRPAPIPFGVVIIGPGLRAEPVRRLHRRRLPRPPDPGTVLPGHRGRAVRRGQPDEPANLIGVFQQDRWSNGGAHGLVASRSTDGGADLDRELRGVQRVLGRRTRVRPRVGPVGHLRHRGQRLPDLAVGLGRPGDLGDPGPKSTDSGETGARRSR